MTRPELLEAMRYRGLTKKDVMYDNADIPVTHFLGNSPGEFLAMPIPNEAIIGTDDNGVKWIDRNLIPQTRREAL